MPKTWSAAALFILWVSITIIASLWVGQVALVPIPILVASLIAACILLKKFPVAVNTPMFVKFIFIAVLFLSAYPLLFLHPFFPASADVLHVTNVRILGEKIPDTYAPYTSLKFTYQIGFALFSNAVSEALFFLPDYQVVWFLGALFSGLIVLFTYWVVKESGGNEKAALVSAALLIGTKFIFQNFYYGVYPLVASFALLLASLLLYEKKSPLLFIVFPATIATHPFSGMILAGFLLAKTVSTRTYKFSLPLFASVVLVFPSLLRTYATLFTNTFAQSFLFRPEDLLMAAFATPFWFGVMPFMLLVLSALSMLHENKRVGSLWLVFSAASFLAYLLLVSIGLQHSDKFFFAFSIFAVLYAGLFFITKTWRVLEERYQRINPFAIAFAVILLVSIAGFFLSSDLTKARAGTKSNVAEQEFAVAFREFDPKLELTIFLNRREEGKVDTHAGWLAAISNKIPYDIRTSHFIPDSEIQVVAGSGWQEVLERQEVQLRIAQGCIECMLKSGAKYLVVNRQYFKKEYGFQQVFAHGDFIVYKIR